MIMKFNNKTPKLGENCFVFENCTLIGDVELAKDVNIWPYATLRGDMNKIIVGEGSNIQESCVIHTGVSIPTIIGKNVTIAHNAIVHSATIGDDATVGMGAIVLDGAVVEEGAVVAAGCVVPPNKVVKKNQLVMGIPMQVVRELTEADKKPFLDNTKHYVEVSRLYMEEMK